MAREIATDFNRVTKFIEEYSLRESLGSKDYVAVTRTIHKKYLSVLCFMGELKHQNAQPVLQGSVDKLDLQRTNFHSYLNESISELGTAFFLVLNGCYKASQQVLRSSIENFLKAIGSTEHHKITRLKNVYQVIELSGTLGFFGGADHKPLHTKLKDLYGRLCRYAHTAAPENMQQVSALGYFPTFDIVRARECSNLFGATVVTMLSILCLMFKPVFHNMHYRNTDVVQASLDAKINRLLHM